MEKKFLKGRSFVIVAALFAFMILASAMGAGAWAAQAPKQIKQKSFANPTEAFGFLVKNINDKNLSNVYKDLFGTDAVPMLSSGNAQEDAANRKTFLDAYQRYHAVELHGGTLAYLIVGRDAWVFPVPVAKRGSVWQFDSAKGRDEINARAIGRNERMALQVCLAYVDAQNDYFDMNPMGTRNPQYAQKIVSTSGTRDGLYWPQGSDNVVSPLGQVFAEAAVKTDGQRAVSGKPFHGYYYRELHAQGANASGGARDYVVDGKMIGGFAMIAFPAEYRKSGIMTFVVNQDGVVYEKNLGANTRESAMEIANFNPDESWHIVDEVYMLPVAME